MPGAHHRQFGISLPKGTMNASEILKLFADRIPSADNAHMLRAFSAAAKKGTSLPFIFGLTRALEIIDDAAPGYATEMIQRMASVAGIGNEQYEQLLQILCEIYIAEGAVVSADVGPD